MPGIRCTVALCNNSKYKNPDLMFHTFPKDSGIKSVWIARCKRYGKWNADTARICSAHFTDESYERNLKAELLQIPARKKLKKTALPTVFSWNQMSELRTSGRSIRQEKRNNNQLVSDILNSYHTQMEFQEQDAERLTDVNQTNHENIVLKLQADIKVLEKKLLSSRKEARKMKLKVTVLTLKNRQLKRENQHFKLKFEKLSKKNDTYLTKSQQEILIYDKKKVKWDEKTISIALALRYMSQRAFNYLRNALKYPLPSLSTLRRWTGAFELRKGFFDKVFNILEIVGKGKQDFQRVVVLEFDEMKIKSSYEYDEKEDEVIGPHSQMQTVLVRGLFDSWKQPIFVDFDRAMTVDFLKEIIRRLHSINYDVVACVSDMGGANRGLWRNLVITEEKSWFQHPVTNDNVYFFADAPHLLKLIRNWLLDAGFILCDGSYITKEPLLNLINMNKGEYKSCHKLKDAHIMCKKAQRQNVRLAAELLSHTTCTALERYVPGDTTECRNLASFIRQTNDWFDLFNSYTPEVFGFPCKSAYGLQIEEQNNVIDNFCTLISTMKCKGKKSLQVFQKGILMSCKSLKNLLDDMKKKYNISYILTHRLNQDALENTFSQLRSKGGLNDHPTPLNALYRLRVIILGKNGYLAQNKLNTIDRSQDDFLVASVLRKVIAKHAESQTNIIQVPETNENKEFSQCEISESDDVTLELCETEEDGLTYVAGWIAKKHFQQYPSLGNYTYKEKKDHNYNIPSWVSQLSYGGLIEPSQEWRNQILNFEKYFFKYHGTGIKKGPNVMENLLEILKDHFPDIDKKILKTYVRIRTFIRIKYLLKQLQSKQHFSATKRSSEDIEKQSKKMKKITT